MNNVLISVQIILAIFLILLILVQSKGTSMGRVWGNSASFFTRRGLERIIFRITFFVTGVFILISILQVTL